MNKSLKILISTSSFARESREPLEILERLRAEWVFNPHGRKLDRAESIALLKDVDGLIAGVETLDREVLGHALRLKVISRCGTGLDNVDIRAAQELGIRIFSTPGAPVNAVAELTLAGILAGLRFIPAADRSLRRGEWSRPMGRLLRGKAVGIIGLGRIGQAVVKLLAPFEVRVLAHDKLPDTEFAASYGVRCCALEELLAEADIVSLHVASDSSLRHLIGPAQIEQMKPRAFLVNTARGGLVDEQALVEPLKRGHLSGAFLDTFEHEPYSGPLAELPNVVLTPHLGSYAAECRAAMETEAAENLARFFQERGG